MTPIFLHSFFASPSRRRPFAAPALLVFTIAMCASADPSADRRHHILTEGRAECWRLRDPREVLTLDRITDPRAAWARIELLAHQNTPDSLDEAEALLNETLVTLRRDAESRADALRGPNDPPGQYNTSPRWPTDPLPFANDPHYWEFDLLPPDARSISLAGLWRFTTDPDDKGLRQSFANPDFNDRDWKPIYAPAQNGWEQHGHADYDGLAWYRKTLRIPPDWKPRYLRLHLGPSGNNVHWVAMNGHFIHPPDREGSVAPYVDIPAKLLRPGQTNMIAIRILNRTGPGGLLGPDLRLSLNASDPGLDRFPCGAGIARQITHRTPDFPTLVTYASALSPAAVIATNQPDLHLAGWSARGYRTPRRCTFPSRGKIESIATHDTAALDPKLLDENWLLLWDRAAADDTPQPLMLVFEHRPLSIRFDNDGFGGRAVQFRFATPGARVALIRPFTAIFSPDLTEEHVARCRLWSRALIKYPIGYLERNVPDTDRTTIHTDYEYLNLPDTWRTDPLPLAPIPTHRNAQPTPDHNPIDLGCRSTTGYTPPTNPTNYFAIPGQSEATYTIER